MTETLPATSDDSEPFVLPYGVRKPETTTQCILGVDPGITGGIAFLFPDNPSHIVAEDIPVAGGEVDVDTLAARILQMRPTLAIIERAGAMPKQGVSSTFKFGTAYGALRAVVAVLRIPTELVHPTKWKRFYGLSSDKEQSRALAIRKWPGVGCFSRKKDHGRSEAALIALYGHDSVIRPDRVHRTAEEVA